MIVYRASELGACTRRLALGRIGYDPMSPPEKYVEYFARGDATEVEVKADLRTYGYLIFDEQLEVVVDVTDEIKVVGHIDGKSNDTRIVGAPMGRTRLLEIKRMNNAYWNVVKDGGWYVDGLMEKYRWQLSAYMLATGLEAMLVCRNGDTGEDHYLYAEEPFHPLNDIKARVLVVEGRARTFGTLADLGACDNADYPCPFYYTHEKDREELDGEEAEEIEGLGVAYLVAKGREQRAKDEVARLRDEISRVAGPRERLVAGRVRFTRYTTSRTSLDRRAIKSDGIDLSGYESTKSYPAVRITVREDDDGNDDKRGE